MQKKKLKLVLLLLFLPLVGCVSGNDAKIYPGLFGQRVVGNEMYVSIGNVWSEMDALPLAEAYCKKYGKSPSYKELKNNVARFDCVAPSK